MNFVIKPGPVKGRVAAPASKSHTIRSVFFASLADGVSTILNPLVSTDSQSALSAVTLMGAQVDMFEGKWTIAGSGGRVCAPPSLVDVGNSGTTARLALSMASLGFAPITITGDEQTRARPMGPLIEALANLGARTKSNSGGLPATIEGPINGGDTFIDGATSQYLSSLLIHTPLAPKDSVLSLNSLNEKPYVDMTLKWLDDLGVDYRREGYSKFYIRGGQQYKPFEKSIPADFSSATFFACLGAIPGNEVTLTGLDMNDTQGDKAVFDYLARLGANVSFNNQSVTVSGEKLKGAHLDLNATPDALPALAALASIAEGTTVLGNTPQARLKETDRIAVMAKELGKMGIVCEEKPDALIIHGGKPKGALLSGHGDHRVVMSLAVAASASSGESRIDTAEAVAITFPDFAALFADCGGSIKEEK
ncbi:MAG TPA: 3-phosphoshikimate 1-carboxyvinyltransferase [Nitrospirae bacterium]|nr:3-phosphoshikimate 1-carboxyvinyltransferase [Nitrospirota bacterium]